MALPLVAVVVLRAGAFEVGLLSALQTAALLVVGLPAGVWIDRMRKRRVMWGTDLIRCVLLAAIPIAEMLGVLSITLLCVIALLVGAAQLFNDVADQTYLPEMIDRDDLGDGNTKLEFIRSGGALAGPSLGGVLVQLIGASRTMGVTALSALASVLLLITIKVPDRVPVAEEQPGMLQAIREGLAFAWRDRLMRASITTTAATNLTISAVLGLSVLFLADTVKLPPGLIGVLLMSGAVGGLLGGLTGNWLFKRFGTARVTWLAITLSSPFGLLLPATQADWRVCFFVITSIGLSWGAILWNVGLVTYRQTVAPEGMLGRINATFRFVVWGMLPLGALLGGIVAQQIGVREALWVFMSLRLISFLPVVFSPLVRMRDFSQVQAGS